jgi:hypothetical protein
MALKAVLKGPYAAYLFLGLYASMLLCTVAFGHYMVFYALMLASFLHMAAYLSGYGFIPRLLRLSLTGKLAFIFLLALGLRSLMLLQDQVITNDIQWYVYRSEWMARGLVPYEDFPVNKPPLYAFMLYLMGEALGRGELQFRAFFVVVDAVVAVMVMKLALLKGREDFAFGAGFLYAVCPLPLISVGIGGHYEPVVMAFVLGSVILLLQKRTGFSAFNLGVGFALKIFPVVLAPFMITREKAWSRRLLYLVIFSLPLALSFGPMLMWSPGAFTQYLVEQGTSWPAKKSYAYCLEVLTGSGTLAGVKYSLIFSAAFLGALAVMWLQHVRDRFSPSGWLFFIVVAYVVYYGLFITASIRFHRDDMGLADPWPVMGLFAAAYFPIALWLTVRYRSRLDVRPGARDRFVMVLVFALILLLFSSSQYNPWYILWTVPLILVIRDRVARLVLLALGLWNFEGMGLELLPPL